MAKRRIGIIAFALSICLLFMPCRALAASTADAKEPINPNKTGSLTLSYCGEGIAFSALPICLYKIADVSADSRYTLAPSFKNTHLILDGITSAGEWNVMCSTLEAYILANNVAADFNARTDAEGKATFDALKPGIYLAMTEDVVRNETTYVFQSSFIALPRLGEDGFWQYSVAATAKCKILPPIETDEEIEFKVTKLWKGDSGTGNRPKSIEIEIFRNGKSYETVRLSDQNHWTYRWKATDDGSDWKVFERNVPAGYTMTVEGRETSFLVTNTFIENHPNTPGSPDTGDASNIMLWFILMILSGCMLIISGITRKRTAYDEKK